MKRFLLIAAAALMFGAPAAMAQSYDGYYGRDSHRASGHAARGYGGGDGYGQRWNTGAYYNDQDRRRYGYNDRGYRHERREMRRAERREHRYRHGYRGW